MNLKQAKRIFMLSSQFCEFCKKTEIFFKRNGIPFDHLSVLTEQGEKQFFQTKAKYNHKTIPMIFINDQFIGGYDDLLKKVKQGEYVI